MHLLLSIHYTFKMHLHPSYIICVRPCTSIVGTYLVQNRYVRTCTYISLRVLYVQDGTYMYVQFFTYTVRPKLVPVRTDVKWT